MTNRNEGGDPKEKADVPPVLPSEQQSATESGGALSPEDLDFTESPYVDEIDDGRYVVSADRSPPNVPDEQRTTSARSDSRSRPGSATPGADSDPESESESDPASGSASTSEPAARSDDVLETDEPASAETDPDANPNPTPNPSGPQRSAPQSPEAARSLLANELEYVDTRFAIDIVSRFDDDTVRHRMTSDDVVGTFNSLVFWYARHVSGSTPTNRAASLLLAKSDFTPPLSEAQVRQAMRTHGLDESSTVEDLLEAIE